MPSEFDFSIDADDFVDEIDKEMKAVPKRSIKALTRAALLYQSEIILGITRGNAGGPPQIRYGAKGKNGRSSKRTVNPSLPGNPPVSDLGNLIKNIVVDKVKVRGKKAFIEIRSKAPYSLALELGTKNMEARPFMAPALKKSEKKIEKILRSSIG